MFEIVEKDLAARIGKLYTKSGTIETPALFPVVNPVKQTLPLSEIQEIGFRQVITNAYLIRRTYGDLAREVSIHGLLSWNGVVMTDSGAYQLMEYGEVEVDPDEIVQYQIEIGSDIGVILDIPTRADTPYETVLLEVEETLRRARRSILLKKVLDPEGRMLLVGPVQGGTYLDLVRYCARQLSKLDFDLYAIGSVTALLEQYEFAKILETVLAAKEVLPPGRPVHLFGAGHPLIIPFAVALGIDLFDSASYIIYARDDRLMLPDRTVRLDDLRTDHVPCTCPVCRKYTVKELLEMPKHEREPLLAKHNLYVLAREIDEVKQRIREGTLWDYLQEKAAANPRAYEALLVVARANKYLLKYCPATRGDVHGINIVSVIDIARPLVKIHVDRILRNYEPPPNKEILIILPEIVEERPCNRASYYLYLCYVLDKNGLLDKVHICFLSPIFGLIPHEIADVYPLAQYEYVRNMLSLSKIGIAIGVEYLRKFSKYYKHIIALVRSREVPILKKIVRIAKVQDRTIIISVGENENLIATIDLICNMVRLLSSSAPPQEVSSSHVAPPHT